MAEVLFFHHAQGLTSGVVAFADELRAAGHTVHTPDLYAGRTFATLEEGVAHAKELGFDNVTEAGVQAADGLPGSWCTRVSRSASGPHRSWPRPGPAPGVRCSSHAGSRADRVRPVLAGRGAGADPRDGR